MPVSTISSSIDNFITLGSGSYADGVTITNTGTVAPTFEAFNTTTGYSYAVNLLASGDTLMNSGTIVGDPRNAGLPNFGGGGLYLKAGSALNLATIRGGQGAATVGGTGVVVEGGSFDNVGIVIGGSSEPPYTGGAGIAETSGYVVNTGTAAGGPGGAVGTGIGPGAAISGGLFENHGLVISAASGQTGTFVNVGTVEIGNVGGTSTFLNAGIVTDGVAASYSGTFINDGIVTSANTVGGTPNGYGLVLRGTITQPTLQHVLNAGTIIGGVYGVAGGTLTNAGVVQANATGVAVEFLDGNAGLIIDPGAQFQGLVTALPSFASGQEMIVNHTYVPVMITDSNVLEFAAGTHAGSIDLGGSFSGFETIGFDSGSAWTLGGTQAELAGGETINGFARADTLVLDGFSSGTDTYVSGTGLVLSGNSGSATLDVTGSFVTSSFKVIAAGSNSVIELACFAAGTHILTPQGEVAVERLAVGQAVITQAGEEAAIKWLGRRYLDLRRHARPDVVQPVRVAAGAFADGVPARDLVLSPDHAVALEGRLVPVKALVNGLNVTQLNRASVTYYHVELAAHDVIFAERLPVESYLETGNRSGFENGGPAMLLHPDFAQARREAESCAPFTEAGPMVAAARQRLCQRAYASKNQLTAAAV